MGYSVKEQALYAELEAVAGTAETALGTDVVQVANLKPNPAENARMIEREIIRSSPNPEQAVYGGSLFGFSFDVELKGSGTIDSPPRYGRLLKACGMTETINASTSVVYTPMADLSSAPTVTLSYREGGNYRIVKGCRGTFSIDLTVGAYGKITFNMKGRIHSESAASAPTPSYEATVPRAFMGANFTVGAFAAKISKFTLDPQNNLVMPPDPNDAEGFSLPRLTSRNTKCTIDPERELISTKDWIALFRAGTNQAIATGTIGGTAGNRFAISVPNAYVRNPSAADRDELMIYELELGARDTTGADDFTITLT